MTREDIISKLILKKVVKLVNFLTMTKLLPVPGHNGHPLCSCPNVSFMDVQKVVGGERHCRQTLGGFNSKTNCYSNMVSWGETMSRNLPW